LFVFFTCEFFSSAQDCLLIVTATPIHVGYCFSCNTLFQDASL
jgi:hypothetical protein